MTGKEPQSFEKLSGRWMRRVLFPPAVNATPTRPSAIQRSVSGAWEMRRAIPRINYAGVRNLAPMKPRISKRRAPTGSLSISLRKVEKDARHNLAMLDRRFGGPWLRPSSLTTTSVCSRIKHGDVRFLHLALGKGRSPAHRHFYCWSFVSKEFLA